MKDLLNFLRQQDIRHDLEADIKPFVSIRIGGRVKLIAIARRTRELKELLIRISDCGIPRVLIGGGTNLVFSDGYSPIAVIVNRTAGISIQADGRLRVSSGVSNRHLVKWCMENSIAGLEFLAGIPGTIGGAAAVNAGSFGKSLSDLVESAEIMDEKNRVRPVEKDFFQYAYRHSIFRTGNRIILGVDLSLRPGNRNEIFDEVNRNLEYRKTNHPPYNLFTAGCFFKNPVVQGKRISAGKIIEKARCHGFHDGKLMVSEKHANFIINTGKAGFRDIKLLETRIMEQVMQNSGHVLEREVIYITPDGKKI